MAMLLDFLHSFYEERGMITQSIEYDRGMISTSPTRFAVLVPFALFAFACAPRSMALVPEAQQSITVSGQGEVFANPDMARVRLGVEERATSAEQAMANANTRMAQITAALKNKGIEAKDVQTTELSMYFEQAPDVPIYVPQTREMGPATKAAVAPGKTAASGEMTAEGRAATPTPEVEKRPDGFYVVRNTVIVSVRKIEHVGAVIGAAMSAGANHLHGFELTIDDPSQLRDQARQDAVKKAIAKAELLAKEAHVKLGPVLSVTEIGGGEPAPMMADRAAMSMKSANVPVEAGELSLTQSVQVVFGIER